MGWISPTGFVDHDSWDNEALAYDEDTETFAYHPTNTDSWSSYLELTIAAMDCNKVRFFARYNATRTNQISLDVYYDDDWHNIYTGAYANEEWVEKTIPAGTKSVTAAQVKFYNDYMFAYTTRLYEFDFGEAAVTHEWEGSDGIAIGEALVKTPMKMLADGFQFSDVTIKEFYKVLTDPIAFTDVWTGYKLLAKVLTDGIAIGEALVKSTSKVVSDGIKFTDTVYRSFEKVLSDGIKLGEVLRKDIAKVFIDGIAFRDIVTHYFEKVFTDGIKFTDCLTHWRWLKAVRNLVRRRCNLPSVREQNSVDDGNI